jgi:hypothetical protein
MEMQYVCNLKYRLLHWLTGWTEPSRLTENLQAISLETTVEPPPVASDPTPDVSHEPTRSSKPKTAKQSEVSAERSPSPIRATMALRSTSPQKGKRKGKTEAVLPDAPIAPPVTATPAKKAPGLSLPPPGSDAWEAVTLPPGPIPVKTTKKKVAKLA